MTAERLVRGTGMRSSSDVVDGVSHVLRCSAHLLHFQGGHATCNGHLLLSLELLEVALVPVLPDDLRRIIGCCRRRAFDGWQVAPSKKECLAKGSRDTSSSSSFLVQWRKHRENVLLRIPAPSKCLANMSSPMHLFGLIVHSDAVTRLLIVVPLSLSSNADFADNGTTRFGRFRRESNQVGHEAAIKRPEDWPTWQWIQPQPVIVTTRNGNVICIADIPTAFTWQDDFKNRSDAAEKVGNNNNNKKNVEIPQ
jgi:hypothetical protein